MAGIVRTDSSIILTAIHHCEMKNQGVVELNSLLLVAIAANAIR
jgi:hypothetical protein